MEIDDTIKISWVGDDEYSSYNFNDTNTITISSTSIPPSSGTITFGDGYDEIKFEDMIFSEHKEFQNIMPDLYKVQQMCEMYPGLKNAYEHFQIIYKLVHDDYLERISSNEDF